MIHDVDINKTRLPLVKKSFKYFIGYKHYEKVVPLCIILPKMSGYEKKNETRCLLYLLKDDELLEK